MVGSVYKQTIQVIIDNIIKGQQKVAQATTMYRKMGSQYSTLTKSVVAGAMKQEQAMSAVAKKQKFLGQWSDKLGVNTRRVSQAMSSQGLIFDKLGNVTDMAGRKVRDFGARMDAGKRATARFKMELLGTMFAGMALWRVTSGLLKAQLDLWGITELMSSTLSVVFLPLMEDLTPLIIDAATAMMNWSDETKKIVGYSVLAAGGLGLFLMLFGQIGLGVTSVIKAFGFLSVIVKGVSAAVGVAVGWVVLVILAVVAVVVGMVVAWKENFMEMRLAVKIFVDGIKRLFAIPFKFFVGIFKAFKALFTGDWKALWEAIKQIFTSVFIDPVVALFQIFVGTIVSISLGIVRVFKWIVEKVVALFVWLYEKLVGSSIIPDMINAMIAWFWKLPKAILEALGSILKAVFKWGVDFVMSIVDGIKSTGRKVIDSILGLFPSWMRKGIEASGKIVINIVKSVTEKIKRVFTGGGSSKNDFIWRPGQAPISINPQDTLVGFKGAPPKLGGGTQEKGEVTINQTNYITVSDREEMEKLIRDNNVKLVEEIKRMVNVNF